MAYQGPAGGTGAPGGGVSTPGVSLPSYGQPAQRDPFQFGQRQSQASPITPAGDQVANNMNNQAMGGWRSQQQDMMGGLQQDVFRQARRDGLLDDDSYVTMQGLLI